ncbi:MAG TPA: hypothetical protein DCY20_10730 [Firmicutes bacterium]|nr:hypothetical protein [Bacillota bacterium]
MQNQATEKITIPLQIETYEQAFFDFDKRPLSMRKLNEDLDSLIKEILFKSNDTSKMQIEILFHLPKAIKDTQVEEETRQGILNHYKAFDVQANKIRKMGLRRLVYYISMSLFLFILYYLVEKYSGVTFLSTMLCSAATVILWQVSTLVFIERKNLNIDIQMNKLLSNSEVRFIYH